MPKTMGSRKGECQHSANKSEAEWGTVASALTETVSAALWAKALETVIVIPRYLRFPQTSWRVCAEHRGLAEVASRSPLQGVTETRHDRGRSGRVSMRDRHRWRVVVGT